MMTIRAFSTLAASGALMSLLGAWAPAIAQTAPAADAAPIAAPAAAASAAAAPAAPATAVPLAVADLILADGKPAGTASIAIENGKAKLTINFMGLPPGTHGLHIHTVGTCTAPDFASAGGHLNPGGHEHGTMNPKGSHMGDLSNIPVGPTGQVAGSMEMLAPPEALAEALFDADGSSIVIHAGQDDYKTDPSGASGARIACGVFRKA